MRNTYRWVGSALLAALLVTAVAACGGGGSSSGGSSSGGDTAASGDNVQTEAAKLLAEAEQRPTQVPEAVPLKGKVPSGKSVVFLGCGSATCEEYGDVAKEGAEALGWSFKFYFGGFEPNKVISTLQNIVRERPDVFISTALAPSLGTPYLKELQANGAITINCCTANPTSPGVTKVISPGETKLATGKALADAFLAEQGEDLHALFVGSKDFEVSTQYLEGFEDEISRLCSNCSSDEIDIAGEDIGKPVVGTTIVSYLRSHPEINAVGALASVLMTGVPAAMAAAGVEMPIGATTTGSEVTEALHEDGKEGWSAGVMFGKEWPLWALNIGVRSMLDEPLGNEKIPAEMVMTTNNAEELYEGEPSTGQPFVVKNALEQYEEIWGLK